MATKNMMEGTLMLQLQKKLKKRKTQKAGRSVLKGIMTRAKGASRQN